MRINQYVKILSIAAVLITFSNAVKAEEKIRWKVQAVFGTHLPGLGDAIVSVADDVDTMSNGDIQFKIFEPGKIVPALEITEAVKNNQIPAAYNWLGYDQGKMPAAALLSATPFGLEPWEYATWWYDAGGAGLAEELYAKHNVHPILCSVIGPETAGWFRNEVNTIEDFQGLKIRFAGIGGKVLQKAGASVTLIPSGEIFPALEKGAIDATEFSMPVIDELLGFDKVVKNNYFPGWHQTFTATHLIINKEIWEGLSDAQRTTINTVCTASTFRALTKGESLQGAVLDGFKEKGVTARRISPELLADLQALTEEVLAEESANDADFKKMYESQKAFSDGYAEWKNLGYLPRGQ